MLEFNERTNLNADIRDEGGNQKVMLHASFGTKSLNLNVEVLDAAYVTQNADSVAADTAQFIAEVCRRAASDCSLPTGCVKAG